MTSLRKTSLSAGIFYLITFVSIPTFVLYSAVKDPDYILGSGPDTAVLIGGLLEVIVGLAGIGTAVALYPGDQAAEPRGRAGFRRHRGPWRPPPSSPGVVSLLSIVTLRQAGAGPDALVIGQALTAQYSKTFLSARRSSRA